VAERAADDSSGEESDGRYSRFEESSRWIKEIGEHIVEAKPLVMEETSNEDFVNRALATLDMLDEKMERVGLRLEQIETRVKEMGLKRGREEASRKQKINEGDSGGLRRSERLRPKGTGGGQVGKGVLVLSMLGMFMT
jgi:hypothetical protein